MQPLFQLVLFWFVLNSFNNIRIISWPHLWSSEVLAWRTIINSKNYTKQILAELLIVYVWIQLAQSNRLRNHLNQVGGLRAWELSIVRSHGAKSPEHISNYFKIGPVPLIIAFFIFAWGMRYTYENFVHLFFSCSFMNAFQSPLARATVLRI
jgi:hypothetical protein